MEREETENPAHFSVHDGLRDRFLFFSLVKKKEKRGLHIAVSLFWLFRLAGWSLSLFSTEKSTERPSLPFSLALYIADTGIFSRPPPPHVLSFVEKRLAFSL
jgi:hypothetical protein